MQNNRNEAFSEKIVVYLFLKGFWQNKIGGKENLKWNKILG